jgi:long-chain acyl-CoA synthetase
MNYSVFMGWEDVLIPKPQPKALLEALSEFKPSIAGLVPTMFIGLLKHPDTKKTDMTSLKGLISGSAPLPLEVKRDFEDMTGSVIVEGFGLTESSPVTHINPIGGRCKIGSIGIPIPDTECRIVDLDNGKQEVPVGERGELLIKGPQVMKEYLNMPEETASAIRDGWLYTGDIATMDEEGYFFIVDRKKDMIISAGCNVYPRDIDEVFYENPKVQEACAIGIPHPYRGEAAKVFVVLHEGETATEGEMLKFCKGLLANYKCPVEVEFRDELPKTNVGKILRKELRAQELENREKKRSSKN